MSGRGRPRSSGALVRRAPADADLAVDEAGGGFWGDALDRLAEAVFGSPAGRRRARPLLDRQDEVIGGLGLGDQPHELLQAMRIDAALCDLDVDGGGSGDTWAWRAASGALHDVETSPVVRALAASQSGIFEVSRRRGALILRECSRGLLVHLAAEEDAWALTDEVALWDARLVLRRSGARLCRRPLAYPIEILPWLLRAGEERWAGRRAPDLLDLRAMWLRWRRSRGGDPAHFFHGHGR